MVYIYKKIIGGKPYYYLRASERKEKKIVVKDLAYLGSSLEEAKKAIANLKSQKDSIRKAYKTLHHFLESNHFLEEAQKLKLKTDQYIGDRLTEVEACRLHYETIFLRQDEATRRDVIKGFVVEFAFNTASIEGNTITLKEARNLLDEGLTPKGRTLREIYDLQNTETVFNSLVGSKEDLTHEFIEKIHSGLMENIDSRKGYRTTDVRVLRATFEASPAPYVKTDMNLLLAWYKKQQLHPLVLAVLFHHKFEKIHPFMDGNGRVGRMLMNHILMRNGYPPAIIQRKFRADYLDALHEADEAGLRKGINEQYLKLVQFVAEEMINQYWNIFL
jgi:Fic family protein